MSLSFQFFSKSFSLFLPLIMYFFSLKLDSMSLFSLSFSFLITSVSTLSTLHPLVLRCTVLPLFCGNPLQFYKTFFMVLVIGVSLLLLPQLKFTSLSLGSFSWRVAQGNSWCWGLHTEDGAVGGTSRKWLGVILCIVLLEFFCLLRAFSTPLKINLGFKKQTCFLDCRTFVPSWFISNLWEKIMCASETAEGIFRTLKFTHASFKVASCWGKLFMMLVTEIVSLVNSFAPERLAFHLCHLLNMK